MKITAMQANVLDNLHRVEFEQRSGKRRATLDGKDCIHQLVGLAVKQLIRWGDRDRPIRIAEPDGILGTRFTGGSRPPVGSACRRTRSRGRLKVMTTQEGAGPA